MERPDKLEVPRRRVGLLTSDDAGLVTVSWALPKEANPKRAHGRGGVVSYLTADELDVGFWSHLTV